MLKYIAFEILGGVSLKKIFSYFTPWERTLWCSSVILIVLSFLIFDRSSYLTLIASVIGVSSLIFIAKGNPIGQGLMVIFCLFYGYISFSFTYYGEMLTYLGMSAPMATVAFLTWLKNPYKGNKSEVAVSSLKKGELPLLILLTLAATVASYFILKYFGTANLLPSTFSVATSFFAVCLCAKRSPFFALAYAINDLVLIFLWILAAIEDMSYFSVIICFVVFLVNDLYSFTNWLRMKKKQSA